MRVRDGSRRDYDRRHQEHGNQQAEQQISVYHQVISAGVVPWFDLRAADPACQT